MIEIKKTQAQLEQELQTWLEAICPLDEQRMDEARARQEKLAKPPGSLGKLEDISVRLAGITGKLHNKTDRCRIIVLCSDNGTATEITASQAEYNLTVMELQSMWQKAVEAVMALCGRLAELYGLQQAETEIIFDWGNGVLFDEEKVWADYMAMAEKGLIAPEVALGWRFNMKAETEAERAAIRQKFMPNGG